MAEPSPTAWRTRAPSPTGPRRRLLLVVLVALVALAGTTLGVMLWLSPPRHPAYTPIWITTEPAAAGIPGVMPWSEQDRVAVGGPNLLGQPVGDAAPNPSRDQIRLRLKALSSRKASQPVVVVLAAPSSIDAAGHVYLLGADPIGDNPRNRIELSEILELVRDCPATRKLVVLDLWPLGEPSLVTSPPGALSTAVQKALDAVPDERRLALLSCDSQQVPFASPALGQTVFGHYLVAGLHGAADGWNPSTTRDGRVSVTELATYAQARVSRWSETAAVTLQTPRLVGDAADFNLRPVSHEDVLAFAAQAPTPLGPYPDWLKTAWAEPAYPLRLERLLAAERAWAAGKPPADVQADFERARKEPAVPIGGAAKRPNPAPSLAALPESLLPADPKLAEELKAAVLKAEARPPAVPPAPAGLWPELEPFKARPHATLAAAVYAFLADDPAPAPNRVRQFDQLLAAQEPVPRFAETLLLRRVTELLADPLAAIDPGTVSLVLRVGRDFEQASIVPTVLEWATPALDDAYARWIAAQAALFSPGYVAPAATEARLADAIAAVRQIKAFADAASQAVSTRNTALQNLRFAFPAYAAGAVALPPGERLADVTRSLVESLRAPAEPLTRDTLGAKVDDWRRHSAEARSAIAEFSRPFSTAALAALRDRAAASDATAFTAREIAVALQTGLTPPGERAALWDAQLALEKRLSDDVTRKDNAEDEAGQTIGYRDPRHGVPAPKIAADPLERQERWSALLLHAGGFPDEPLRVSEKASLAVRLERLRTTWLEHLPARLKTGPDHAALELVLPQRANEPLAVAAANDVWAWQARRFQYEAHDPIGPVAGTAGVAFATEAARACREATPRATFEPYLDVTPPTGAAFGAEATSARFEVGFRLIGAASPAAVTLRSFTLFPQWLVPQVPATLELSPGQEQRAPLSVAVADAAVPGVGAQGVLLEATLGSRTFHRRVPVSLDAVVNRLGLFVAADPKAAPRALTELRLRPHGQTMPYVFLLSNPGPKPRTLVVRLTNLGVETPAVTVPARGLLPLAFPAPAAPPAAPQPAGQPPVPAGPVLRDLTGPLQFEVLEGEPRKVVQHLAVPVSLLDPSRYLTVTDVVFRPAFSGRPNSLTARVVPETPLDNPPCPVELVLPVESNPALMVRDGKLKGTLPPDGQALRLYAEGLSAGGVPPARLYVTITADGSERAFTYAGAVPPDGETVRLAPVTAPLVRVRASEYASGVVPLPVRVEVDNPPAGSRLELRLGTYADDRFVPDAEKVIDTPRERVTSVGVKAPDGAVLLRAVLRDWEATLPVEFLVGARDLEARLKDASGNVVAQDRVRVTFDNAPPGNIQFLSLPPRIARDKPLTVRATSDAVVSGIKEVKFFAGKPLNNAAPPGVTAIPGKLIDAKANLWEAVLPPVAVGGPVTLSALFTSRAGINGVGSQDAEALDSAELNKPPPGVIAGKVIEGTLPQGGLEVILYDDKAEKGRVKTKPDGTFQFADLPPGKYRLIVQKESTSRKADTGVEVKAGETKTVTLELYL